jgi:hypothetical protein
MILHSNRLGSSDLVTLTLVLFLDFLLVHCRDCLVKILNINMVFVLVEEVSVNLITVLTSEDTT